MAYIIYNIATSRIEDTYNNATVAKRQTTRLNNKAGEVKFAFTDGVTYYANIEQFVEKINLMTGLPFKESVNTSFFCSPSSETYWSM
jgi:hypothetical protein